MQDDNNDLPAGAFTIQQWIDSRPEFYDLGAEFDQRVIPIINQAKAVCEELGIPFIFIGVPVQNETGCENRVTCSFGGIARATVGILAAYECGKDTLENVPAVAGAAGERFKKHSDILKCDCDKCQAQANAQVEPAGKTVH